MNIVNYDPEVDAAYLKIKDGESIDADVVTDAVIIHCAEDDSIVGVELIGATKLDPNDWRELEFRLPEAVCKQLREASFNKVVA